jgi:hypothetical protein
MKIRLVDGPLSGKEVEVPGQEAVDLLDNTNNKVRRYWIPTFAFFVKEWETLEDHDKEVYSSDTPAGTGQLGEDDISEGAGGPE